MPLIFFFSLKIHKKEKIIYRPTNLFIVSLGHQFLKTFISNHSFVPSSTSKKNSQRFQNVQFKKTACIICLSCVRLSSYNQIFMEFFPEVTQLLSLHYTRESDYGNTLHSYSHPAGTKQKFRQHPLSLCFSIFSSRENLLKNNPQESKK